jgi:alanine-glyoxylate transaminase / serine-glyoxylate transaminase / serine-pyruvate transaminase
LYEEFIIRTHWKRKGVLIMNKETLLVPGPTPVLPEIFDALGQETMGHTDPRFVTIFKRAIENTKMLFQTDGEVYIIAGSGTVAMEMAIINTVAKGERLLIISHGYFGDRFTPLAKAYGIEVDVLQAPWGERVAPEAVEKALQTNTYKAVTITHADTSTGVSSDLEQLVPLIKKYNALVIVDGVVATAALQEDMSKCYGNDPSAKIDVVLTGSQKAIGIPPGLAIVAFSKVALQAQKAIEHIPSYYMNVDNWRGIMDNPGQYFATPPVNLIYAYDKAIQIVLEESMEIREARHIAYGKGIRAALGSYGMKALASESVAAPTLSCMYYPDGIDDVLFRKALAERGIVVAGSLAQLAGKAFRIGHMGNTTREQLEHAIIQIGEVLQQQGVSVNIASAVRIWQEHVQIIA